MFSNFNTFMINAQAANFRKGTISVYIGILHIEAQKYMKICIYILRLSEQGVLRLFSPEWHHVNFLIKKLNTMPSKCLIIFKFSWKHSSIRGQKQLWQKHSCMCFSANIVSPPASRPHNIIFFCFASAFFFSNLNIAVGYIQDHSKFHVFLLLNNHQ